MKAKAKPILPSKRIAKLIEAIEGGKEGQHVMSQYLDTEPSCGTAGCIAGWASLALARDSSIAPVTLTAHGHCDNLRYFLGKKVPAEVLEHLVAGQDHDGVTDYNRSMRVPRSISLVGFDFLSHRKRKSMMLKVLRTFAETGRVEWYKIAGRASHRALDNSFGG